MNLVCSYSLWVTLPSAYESVPHPVDESFSFEREYSKRNSGSRDAVSEKWCYPGEIFVDEFLRIFLRSYGISYLRRDSFWLKGPESGSYFTALRGRNQSGSEAATDILCAPFTHQRSLIDRSPTLCLHLNKLPLLCS